MGYELFDILRSICLKTKKYDRDFIEEHYIGSFMIRRWLSFIAPEKYIRPYFQLLSMVNEDLFNDKYTDYLYLYNIFPKVEKLNFRGAYIKKKIKKHNKKEKQIIDITNYLASSLDISKLDAKLIMDNPKFDLDKFKEI